MPTLSSTTATSSHPSSGAADPELRRFDALWRSHARRGRLPAMDHIDPSAVGELIDRLLLVDVVIDGRDPDFRPIVVGEELSAADDPLAGEVRDSLLAAMRLRLPRRCGDHVAYPLASNGRDVDSLICVRSPI